MTLDPITIDPATAGPGLTEEQAIAATDQIIALALQLGGSGFEAFTLLVGSIGSLAERTPTPALTLSSAIVTLGTWWERTRFPDPPTPTPEQGASS